MSAITTRREADVPIASIEVGDRLRKPDLPTIAALAEDFAERGMLQRIGVRERADGKHNLVWGRHRLEAAAKLGWATIGAVVYQPGTPDTALAVLEIVENLRRRELSPEERAEHPVRLAALVKEQPGAKLSAAESLSGKGPGGRGKKGVVQKVAEQAGMSQQAVRRAAERADADLERDTPAELRAKAEKVRAAPKPKGIDGDRRKTAAPKPPKAEPARETGAYTVNGFTHRYTIPAKGDTKLELAWLRHAPVDGVAKWLRPALGAERVAELAERLAKAV
jgi:ParB-like chromosome segregation protein Spo0J